MYYYNIIEFLSEERQRIKVDRSFQRKVCWSLEQKRRFILSFFQKRTPYPIVLADVRTGIKHSKQLANSQSLETYQNLGPDYAYISLDGQNRVGTLYQFVNNEFTITGIIRGADGVDYPVKNCLYKDLPTRVKDAFDMLQISVHVLKNCLYSELHEIFVNINDGEGLNEQEKRNAIMTWFSSYIREFAETEKYQDLLLKVNGISSQDIRRSKDAEWFAKMFASLTTSNKYINQAGLDAFYRQGEARDRAKIDDYSATTVNRFESIVEMVYQAVFCKSSKGTPITQKLMWALVQVASDVYDSPDGKKIQDYVKFFEVVKEEDQYLCSDSQEKFAQQSKRWQANQKGSEPKKSGFYFHWASDVNKPSVRTKRRDALLKRLSKNPMYAECFISDTEKVIEVDSLEELA